MTCYDERLKRFLLLHLLFLLPVPGVFPGGRSNKALVRMVGRLPRCGEGYSYFCAFMKCDVTLTYCFHYDQKSCVGVYPEFRVNFLDYDNPLLLKNAPLTCVVPGSALYVLSSVQVHVGMEGRKGSEHKLQGRSFDGELHLVHVRRDFWKPSTSKAGGRPSRVNLRSASQTPLGLAVNAIFLSVSDGEKNEELDTFLSAYNTQIIQRSKGQDSRAWFRMRPGRLLPRFSDYYQYFGSLTSPPCSEVVNWIVMKQPLKITKEQLTALHQLQSRQAGTPLRASGNVRPTLPLNGRLVTANGPSC